MNQNRTGLLFAPIFLAIAPAASAAISLGFLTFEENEPSWGSFAQTTANVTTVQDIAGAGGTRGIATRVTGDPGTFAGGGVLTNSPFMLSTAGIAAGTVTVSDFNNIRGSFDINLPVGQSVSIRLEPGNGGFNERVAFPGMVTGTGVFQTINLDATLATSETQKTTFVNTLNAGNTTAIKFVFSINNQTNSVGSDFIFDNVTFSVVPEPTSVLSLALGGLLLISRRRR